ncbi:hypothetical protein SUGI_0631530 [Cryptomeria japonica]|nr:hypothetical protein SUGI_0631530 [Cryptomeria japonica]
MNNQKKIETNPQDKRIIHQMAKKKLLKDPVKPKSEFEKRIHCLFKKVHELSVLCRAQGHFITSLKVIFNLHNQGMKITCCPWNSLKSFF